MSVSTTPRIRTVYYEVESGDLELGTGQFYTVWTCWDGVDRPATHGFACKNEKMANRLIAAIEAGAVFYDPQVRTDVNGQTYVEARSRVLGRYMNADLKRLGF